MGLLHSILTKVPRPILIRLSYVARPIYAAWLSGSKYQDPIDGKKYRKLLPYGAHIIRQNALAPAAMSLERHRLMWLYLQNESNFFSANNLKVLHMAPEQCFYGRFRKQKNLDYTTADLFSPLADVKADLHALPFDDNSYDVVFCNHVLEHVEDYKQCMRELYRVMKPGGWGIFQVPIDYKRQETYEDKSITSEADRLKHYWQKDHVRLFGLDYPKHLESVGFRVDFTDYGAKIDPALKARYCLMDHDFLPVLFKD